MILCSCDARGVELFSAIWPVISVHTGPFGSLAFRAASFKYTIQMGRYLSTVPALETSIQEAHPPSPLTVSFFGFAES